MIRVGGCKRDVRDDRDYRFCALTTKLPIVSDSDSVDLRQNCSNIENQINTGSCVAQSTVGALELLENISGLEFVDLSRLFVYYNARLAIGEADRDEGTQIRLAMATLSSLESVRSPIGHSTFRRSQSGRRGQPIGKDTFTESAVTTE